MPARRTITMIALGVGLAGFGGVAHAWECPPSVCSAGQNIEDTVGGIDWTPGVERTGVPTVVRNGGRAAGRSLDKTTTGTWDSTVGQLDGDPLTPVDIMDPSDVIRVLPGVGRTSHDQSAHSPAVSLGLVDGPPVETRVQIPSPVEAEATPPVSLTAPVIRG